MRRNQKQSAAIALMNSANLAPQDAGLPARRGGAVGQPAWVPEDVDFHKVPEAVRQAVAEIIEPAYRQLVTEVEDPLERSVGVTPVRLKAALQPSGLHLETTNGKVGCSCGAARG